MTKKDIEILKKEFGNTISRIRHDKGLSLREVGYRCNLDNSKISKIEKGKINISLSTLADLAQGLEMHPSELLKGTS
jgi:transcriptional regulator with XRE-family HTH domain